MINFAKKVFFIFIIAFIVIIFLIYIYPNRYYDKDYYAALGLTDHSSANELISIYGEPKNIIDVSEIYRSDTEKNIYYRYVYDDFSAVLMSSAKYDGTFYEPICTSYFEVYSERFKFGKEKLSIGSSREEVQAAYKKCKKAKQVDIGYKPNEDSFFDNHVYITYCYDKNDVVNLIDFYWYY